MLIKITDTMKGTNEHELKQLADDLKSILPVNTNSQAFLIASSWYISHIKKIDYQEKKIESLTYELTTLKSLIRTKEKTQREIDLICEEKI